MGKTSDDNRFKNKQSYLTSAKNVIEILPILNKQTFW